MKNGVFWDVTPRGYCKNRRFGGARFLRTVGFLQEPPFFNFRNKSVIMVLHTFATFTENQQRCLEKFRTTISLPKIYEECRTTKNAFPKIAKRRRKFFLRRAKISEQWTLYGRRAPSSGMISCFMFHVSWMFSQMSFGTLHHVTLVITDVSEEHIASIFRVMGLLNRSNS
jgi:hypothetical protein